MPPISPRRRLAPNKGRLPVPLRLIPLGPDSPLRAPRRPRNTPRESLQQREFVAWARSPATRTRYPALANLFAVPNGGFRGKATAQAMKAEGAERGVPDQFLAYPAGGHAGLFLEAKIDARVPDPDRPGKTRRRRTRPTAEQQAWHARLRAAGYAVAIWRSVEEAQALVATYLGGQPLPRWSRA